MFGLKFPSKYSSKYVYDIFTSPSKVNSKDPKEANNLVLIKSFIHDLLKLYNENYKEGQEKKCFVDFLMKEKADAQLIEDELMTFFISGVHTTNSLLSLTVFNLARHPEIQRKLQKSLDEYLKSNVVDQITELKNINYVRACINETARLYPLINVTTRVDEENDIVFDDGYVIPKGTCVILPLSQVLQDPDLWKDTDKFQPERFRRDGIQFPLQYSPFGFAGGH
jgi:cytochrome P450